MPLRTDTQANRQDVRNILAFTDVGEHPDYMSSDLPIPDLTNDPNIGINPNRAPSNFNNDLFLDLTGNSEVMGFSGAGAAIGAYINPDGSPYYAPGIHYERVGNARRLAQTEFTYNDRLGFISLRAPQVRDFLLEVRDLLLVLVLFLLLFLSVRSHTGGGRR